MTDFTETYEILVNVPPNAGSQTEPYLFYTSPGVHNDSLNFYLQYGKKSQQFLMHVRNCTSQSISLHCTHARSKSAKCDALVKMMVLDPKILNFQFSISPAKEVTKFR
jgi:hypothetical protein